MSAGVKAPSFQFSRLDSQGDLSLPAAPSAPAAAEAPIGSPFMASSWEQLGIRVPSDWPRKKVRSGPRSSPVGKDNAVAALRKLLDDPIAQRHSALQKYGRCALGEAPNSDDVELSSLDPIADICLINSSRNEKPPPGFEVLDRTVSGSMAHMLKPSGNKYLLCFRRAPVDVSTDTAAARMTRFNTRLTSRASFDMSGISGVLDRTVADTPTMSRDPSAAPDNPALATPSHRGARHAHEPSVISLSGVASTNEPSPMHRQASFIMGQASLPSAAADNRPSHITDIRFARKGEIPFGYTPITKTASGQSIYTSLYLCYTRSGCGYLKKFAVIQRAKQDKVPAGFVLLPHNVNEAPQGSQSSDSDDASLCVLKDLSSYVNMMGGSSFLQSNPFFSAPPPSEPSVQDGPTPAPGPSHPRTASDAALLSSLGAEPKYLVPFAIACHMLEPALGTVAAMQLQQLLSDGFFDWRDQQSASLYLSGLLTALCDALATCSDASFQHEVLGALKAIVKRHLSMLSNEAIVEIVVACFHVPARAMRLTFLQMLIEVCVLGPTLSMLPADSRHPSISLSSSQADAPAAPASDSEEKEREAPRESKPAFTFPPSASSPAAAYCESIVRTLADTVADASLFQPLLLRWQNMSLFDLRFTALCDEMACLLFPADAAHAHARLLATAMLVLCKIAGEDESDLRRQKYRFGLSRKHTALLMMQYALDKLYLGGGGILAHSASLFAAQGLASSLGVPESPVAGASAPPQALGTLSPFQLASAIAGLPSDASAGGEDGLLRGDRLDGGSAEHDDEEGPDLFDMRSLHTPRRQSTVFRHLGMLSAFSNPSILTNGQVAAPALSTLSPSPSASPISAHFRLQPDRPAVPSPSLPDAGSDGASAASPVPSVLSNAYLYPPLQMDYRFAFLLRRVLFSTLLNILQPVYNAASDPTSTSNRTFSAVLMFFSSLWKRFPSFFKHELGVLLDHILLEFANHELTPVDRRHAIVRTLKEVFDTPQAIVDLYYNYDNVVNWNIFERLLSTLAKVLEDVTQIDIAGPGSAGSAADLKNQQQDQTSINIDAGRNRGATVEFDAQINSVDGEEKRKPGPMRSATGVAPRAASPASSDPSTGPPSRPASAMDGAHRTATMPQLPSSSTFSSVGPTLEDEQAHAQGQSHAAGDKQPTNPASPRRDATLVSFTGGSIAHMEEQGSPAENAALSKPVQEAQPLHLTPQQALQMSTVELVVFIVEAVEHWFSQQLEVARNEMARAVSTASASMALGEVDEEKSVSGFDLVDQYISGHASRPSIGGTELQRKGTVMHRFTKQKADKKALDTAMRIARTKSLEKAIAHLEGIGFLKHDPEVVAAWIHKELNKLDLEVVGEYLGGKRPKDEAPFEEQVRVHYISKLHLMGMTLQEALRRFLTESGFRLPAESQKIERLLCSFSDVYCRDNPKTFDDPDAVFVLANAILMLNTSLHNPNVREKERLTLSQFVSICRGIEGTHFLPKDFEEIYKEIRDNGYQIELTANIRTTTKKGAHPSFDEKALDPREKYVRKVQAFIRKAEFLLKRADHQWPAFRRAAAPETVISLFEVSWYQFMATLSHIIERSTDTRVVSACLDGFKHTLRLCTRLQLNQEKNALASSLARFRHIYRNRLSEKPKPQTELNTELVKGLHLKQSWVDVVNAAMGDDMESLTEVTRAVDELKKEYIRDTNFKVLREIQARIIGDVNLVLPGRYFIREGNIGKMCSNGQKRVYRLFLFSDALLYASAKGSSFKAHRVIMLAFARVVPIKEKGVAVKHSFRLVSPQKTIVFYANSARSKEGWVESLTRQIDRQRVKREDVIKAAQDLASQGKQGITQQMVSRLQYTAAFVGRTAKELIDGNPNPECIEGVCILCMRIFKLFNRKTQCQRCHHSVCGSCMGHKISIPPDTKRKVAACDGCYGLSQEYRDHVLAKYKVAM